MIKLIKYTVLISGVVFFLSCEKKPDAYFTTNKSTYFAGDTVLLINTSAGGSKFEWEMPDGSKSTEENASFIIPSNSGFTDLSFKLNARSKGRKKVSSTMNTVHVIPASTFTFYNNFNATTKTCRVQRFTFIQGSTTQLDAYNTKPIGFGANEQNQVDLNFPSLNVGTYTVATSFSLTSNYCALNFYSYSSAGSVNCYFDQGIVNVEFVNGTVHVFFTNVNYISYGHKISGDLYYLPPE